LIFTADSNLVPDNFTLTIINQKPYFINVSTTVTIYDGLTDRLDCRDPESSNLLTILNKASGGYPSWVTHSGGNTLNLRPN